MSQKKTFVTLEQLKEINKTYPTPYHLYDEKGIRANAERLKKAFSWNKGYREYFAVKATPNPFILNILKEIQERERIAYLFISHDREVVSWFTDEKRELKGGRLYDISGGAGENR